jgi:hypothetical protein
VPGQLATLNLGQTTNETVNVTTGGVSVQMLVPPLTPWSERVSRLRMVSVERRRGRRALGFFMAVECRHSADVTI